MVQTDDKTLDQLNEEADIAADYLEGLLDIADYEGDIEMGVRNGRPMVQIVADDDTDIKHLIGKNGEVVDALQQLTRLAVQQATGERSHLIVDVDGFLKRKRQTLRDMALDAVDEVRETGNKAKLQVSAKDKSTFVVTLSAPCAYFIEGICTAVATMPLRRDLTEDGAGFDMPNVVSNGAYHVSAWSKSSKLTAVRNEEYYEARLVGPDELGFVFASGSEEAWKLYEAGDIDYIAHLPDSVIAELSQDENWKPTAVYATACVLYNHESDLFSNEHTREAFDLAIDRAAAAAAGGAENTPATGLVPYGISDSGETDDDFRTTGGVLRSIDEEDVNARQAEAREELSYAGYYSTSMFPPIELLYVTGTENDAVAAALQNMWSTTLGVTVMLRGVTQAEYNTRMEAGNYELALQKVTALYDDAMGFLDRWCSEDEQNLISYENGTYDVLMGVAGASENPVARTAFLHDAETMLLGETALSPVYFDGTAHMLRDTLRGVYTDGFGNSYFAGVRANTD